MVISLMQWFASLRSPAPLTYKLVAAIIIYEIMVFSRKGGLLRSLGVVMMRRQIVVNHGRI